MVADLRTLGARAAVAAALVVLLGLSACGEDQAPSGSAPTLATRLAQVDKAIAVGDYEQARASLDHLAAATAQAHIDGRITEDQSSRILDAVAATMRALDTVQPKQTSPETTPDLDTVQPEDEAPQEDEDGGDNEGQGDDDAGEQGGGKKDGKKDGKKSGNGPRSRNGPDDGHRTSGTSLTRLDPAPGGGKRPSSKHGHVTDLVATPYPPDAAPTGTRLSRVDS